MFASGKPLREWFAKWRGEADPAMHLADMRAANPILIPRNHRVEVVRLIRGDRKPAGIVGTSMQVTRRTT